MKVAAQDLSNILIVDDNEDSLRAVSMMVRSFGHTPLPFSNAKVALSKLAGKRIALVMTDLMMPEMNGYELLKELKKSPENAAVPVIMLTARDEDHDILQGYNQGVDYYITKPFSRAQLKYALDMFLPGEQKQS